jgi:GT2 family glycosyltransferase
METCRASIILVVYNGMQYLSDCLGAVMEEQQAYPGCEVVVVDNASADGSVDWMATHYPAIRLLRNERNLGFAAACNQGAAAASGEALFFLNQDTRVQPGWLKTLVEGLYQGENVGLTTSKLLFMSRPEQINLCGQDILYTGMTFGRGTLRPSGEFNAPEEVGTVAGASFAIRRSLWEQLGGFDPAFFMYYEETDLSWRASLLGYSSRYIPDSVALHDAGLKPSPGAAYYSARNRQMLLWKHWKWTTLFLLMPAWFMTELVEWVYLMRLGSHYTTGKLRACAWLLAHPRQILRARRSAQMGRKVSDLQLLGQCTWRLSPRVLPISETGWGLIRMANGLLALNYRVCLKLAQWLKL